MLNYIAGLTNLQACTAAAGRSIVPARDPARRTRAEKFGFRMMEGYGATGAAPVMTVNTPMHLQTSGVGRARLRSEARYGRSGELAV